MTWLYIFLSGLVALLAADIQYGRARQQPLVAE